MYEPDETKGWETNDLIMRQANPVSLEIEEIWEDLLKKRSYAVAVESARENFVTKHLNIIYQGAGTETYVDVKDVQECKVSKIDWRGRVVYLGLDLSETNDNTSVSMVAVDDDNNILAESYAFIPEGRIEEKSASEKVNYRELCRHGKVIACGDRVIDYAVVEDFILSLESKYGVQIQAIGYDRWNALSTAQKLEKAGYNMVEIRQHSSVLYPPTKRLKECILNHQFQYTENKMLEMINTALAMQRQQSSPDGLKEVIALLKRLIQVIAALSLSVDIDTKKLSVMLKQAEKDLAMLGG
jgi:phage terminase large subunit-like protein